MMDQKFIDKIEELRHHTYSRITELQKDLCPMVRNIYMNHQYEYWYDGYKYNIWEIDVHLYAVNEIPYCYDNELKNTVFKDTLDHLVEQDKVWPFILFVEGVAIPWSKITIIHDYDYSYLRIDGLKRDSQPFMAKMVVFPIASKYIRYGEDSNVLLNHDRKGFYFDLNGRRLEDTDFVKIGMRLEILDPNIYYKEINLFETPHQMMELEDLPVGYIPTIDNIITFNDTGLFNESGSEKKIDDIYNGTFGLFKVLQTTTPIKWAICMYNTKHANTQQSSMINREDVNKDLVKSIITANKNNTSSTDWNTIIAPLIKPFDFDHSRDLTYEKNIENSAKYITQYDFNLWKDVFAKESNVRSICYEGNDFKALADTDGYIHLSRKFGDTIESSIIMFVNNRLYQYMIDVVYTTNTINVPIFGILDGDHVEILMFTICNNKILELTVPNANTDIYIHDEYNLDDCYLMSEYCPDSAYEVPDSAEDRKNYIVDFTYSSVKANYYRIQFTNTEYYGRKLKLVPKKQFRYYRFKQKDNQYKVILPTQFNYCHNPDQYMIFINGQKIDKTEYTITFMNKYSPFDKLVLYFTTILDKGDYIDIFYIPEVFVEKYKQSTIPKSGMLALTDTPTDVNYPTTYPLSKDTSLVFINGLKVNPLDIKDIDLNTLLINMDKYNRDKDGNIVIDGTGKQSVNKHYVDSVNNITIMEYIVGDNSVAQYLIKNGKSVSDSWKVFITNLLAKYATSDKPYNGLQKIFGAINELETPAANYKDNFASLKTILYDVIIDFYLGRNDVTTGDKFVYDFHPEYFDNEAEGSNTKIVRLFPDKDKLLNYIAADLVADTDDVKDGKKFIPANQ